MSHEPAVELIAPAGPSGEGESGAEGGGVEAPRAGSKSGKEDEGEKDSGEGWEKGKRKRKARLPGKEQAEK